ncbi:ATP-dependent nuclease [Photobacterium profundum]|uniref:AAA domain-containing protein n=1 Tax=Photobacterium profundum (strain SS9) TaxID=298386 RepID=Q6LR70_PHOPR|nr:AAA family ATPase [Photobacterium profundum]CAG20206.1 hypothetical protein PBPRA1801 [Photobacterium profundum SS9]
MRLKSVYISEYKNLNGFTLDFSQDSFLEVFVGKNGSGKSNFIEALVEILRHIYEYDWGDNRHELYFNYTLRYEIDGTETTISFNAVQGQLKINEVERATVGQTPKPDNILIYYAGHNKSITAVLKQYEEKFSNRIQRADASESRPFIGVGSSYNELFLTVIMLLPDESPAKSFVMEKLGIDALEDSLKVNLKRPVYAQRPSSTRNFDIQSEEDKFWKLVGTSREFLDVLEDCPLPEDGRVRTEGYLASSDTYQMYYSLHEIRNRFNGYTSLEFFRAFDNLKTLGMLDSLSLTLKLANGREISSNMFSDGQFQAIYLFAISEIFKNANSVTLMDEPDSFLHPEWQAECSEQLQHISSEATASNHILMTTHSAVTLINSPHQRVRYFDLQQGTVRAYTLPKREAVRRLCSNVIKYTEQEQMLSVLNAIYIDKKPVLFTEGSTDPVILKAAWYKLYPTEEMPFIAFYAFTCSYINQLITDERIHNEMDGRPIFALFDFDEAYNQWHSLNGQEEERPISDGLIKKWSGGDAFAIMLPIPNNRIIQQQVFTDDTLTTHHKGRSSCAIEHIFYGVEGLDQYFNSEPVPGGRLIKFQGCKTTFAKEIVPTLASEHFETFRPVFEFIRQKCEESTVQSNAA